MADRGMTDPPVPTPVVTITNVLKLHREMALLAPISGVSDTGDVAFDASATSQQKQAVLDALAKFQDVPDPPAVPGPKVPTMTERLAALEVKMEALETGKKIP